MRRGKPPARAGPQRQGELSRGKRGGASVRALFFVPEAKAPPRGNHAAGRRRRKGKRSNGDRRENGGAGARRRGGNGEECKNGGAGAAQDGSRDRIFRAVRGTKDTEDLLVCMYLL